MGNPEAPKESRQEKRLEDFLDSWSNGIGIQLTPALKKYASGAMEKEAVLSMAKERIEAALAAIDNIKEYDPLVHQQELEKRGN